MAIEGAGSARIVLVGRRRDRPPADGGPRPPATGPRQRPVSAPRQRPATDAPARPATGAQQRPAATARESREAGEPSAWTVRRLVNGASLGGIATVAGGVVFQRNFEFLGNNNAPVLAMGFGLFVVGMIVFTLCLIGLAAAAARALLAGPGRGAVALAALAPTAVLAALFAAGVVSLAFPALFAIVVVGGLTIALRG
jgi:hypothetical protein